MAVFSGNGSNTTPSFTFSSDTDSGLYRIDADKIGIATGGVKALTVTSQSLGVGPDDPDNAITASRSSTGACFLNTKNATVEAYYGVQSGGSGGLAGTITAHPMVMYGYNTEFFRLTDGTNKYLRMASGTGGIQFGGDTAAAKALNDYEEGTWTPTLINGIGSAISVGSSVGSYVKVGRMCLITGSLTSIGATGTAVTDYYINNLPFDAKYSDFGGSTPTGRGGTDAVWSETSGTSGFVRAQTWKSSPPNCVIKCQNASPSALYFAIVYQTS